MSTHTFLGTFDVDVSTHPVYSQYTQSDWAMLFIEEYGQIDGSHHKQWVIDQVARILKGTPVNVSVSKYTDGLEYYNFNTQEPPSQQYLDWVTSMLGEQYQDGSYEYGYDIGVNP